jgi:hypothetical protein
MQVMKAGVDGAQRRRMGENGLIVAMDPRSQRLLRHEEVPCLLPSLLSPPLGPCSQSILFLLLHLLSCHSPSATLVLRACCS